MNDLNVPDDKIQDGELAQPDNEQPMTVAEIRYLVFAMLSELHRQRELLAMIAMELADDDTHRKRVQELLDKQDKQEYTVPFMWFGLDDAEDDA